MDEITSALRVAGTAIRAVRIIDMVKKGVVASSALLCLLFAVRFWRR